MKKTILTLMIVGVALTGVNAQQNQSQELRLSLAEAQQYAIEHNYSLQNAGLDVKKAEASRWQSISSMLPQVKAGFDYQNMCGYEMNLGNSSSSYSSMIPDSIQIGSIWMPISLPASSGSSISSGIPMNPSGTFSITASIALTGAQIMATLMSDVSQKMSDISYKQSLQETRNNVRSIYTSILVMEDIIKLLDSSLANMETLARTTEESVKVGAAEQTDADKIAVQVATMRYNIRSNQSALKILYNSMILQLGADVNSHLVLTTPLESIVDVEGALRMASQPFHIENNYSFQLLEQTEKLSEHQLTNAWLQYTPTLSAYYQYSNKTYFGRSEGFNMTPPNMVGASISLPIFQSGTRMAKVREAKIAHQENMNSKQQAEDGLRVQYNQLCYDLVNAIERYRIQESNLDVTQRVLNSTTEKYKYGRASSLEVTTASNDLINAESNYINAVLTVISAQVALQNLLGEE